ncbi:unnamed protein product, partial [Amoebophrya sp. A25]
RYASKGGAHCGSLTAQITIRWFDLADRLGVAHPRTIFIGILCRVCLDMIKGNLCPERLKRLLAAERSLLPCIKPASFRSKRAKENVRQKREKGSALKG